MQSPQTGRAARTHRDRRDALSMLIGPYDRADRFPDEMRARGLEVVPTYCASPLRRQRLALTGEFDVAEMFLGRYLADLSVRSLEYTALPVFTKRMFVHRSVFVRVDGSAEILLRNRDRPLKVGIQSWLTTTAIWARALLEKDYDFNMSRAQWVIERVDESAWTPPDWLEWRSAGSPGALYKGLASGAIDVAISSHDLRRADLGIKHLYQNVFERERSEYVDTGVYPLMHVLTVKTDLLRRQPSVGVAIVEAWRDATRLACQAAVDGLEYGSSPWPPGAFIGWDVDKMVTEFAPDLSTVTPALQALLRHARDQAIVPAHCSLEDLFVVV